MQHVMPQNTADQSAFPQLAGSAWLSILRGVVAIVFGLVALFRPGIALSLLIAVFGIYALVDGVLALFASVRMAGRHNPWIALLLEGIVGVAAGIIAFVTPGLTAVVLVIVIAAWALITGCLEIVTAIELRKHIPNEWGLALTGVLSVIFGGLLFWHPISGMVAVVWIIGIYALLFGVLMIYVGTRLRRFTGS